MLSKIEKNLLFGTTRNRQVIAETTKSSGFPALERAFSGRRSTGRKALCRVPKAAGSTNFVGRTTAEDLNPGDRIPRQYAVRAIPR